MQQRRGGRSYHVVEYSSVFRVWGKTKLESQLWLFMSVCDDGLLYFRLSHPHFPTPRTAPSVT